MNTIVFKNDNVDTQFEILEKNTKLTDALKCAVCCEIISNPMITNCFHRFCSTCIQKCCNRLCASHTSCQRGLCPLCKIKFCQMELRKEPFIQSVIDSLQIKCLNYPKPAQNENEEPSTKRVKIETESCGHLLHVDGIKNHLQTECKYSNVKCSFKCGFRTSGYLLPKHESECLKNPTVQIHCVKCGEKIFATKSNEHKTRCPKEEIDCKYMLQGCNIREQRCDQEKHLYEHGAKHAELCMTIIRICQFRR